MRNLVGVAMRSRFGALDHDIRRVRFAPSTDIVSLAGQVRKVPTADMPVNSSFAPEPDLPLSAPLTS